MKVLIIEDDRALADAVQSGLRALTHTVDVAEDGAGGSFMARSYEYDAIVLDYSLPKKNGVAVCREIRAAGKTTPILFMSVVGDAETKVAALEEGADDYVTKPVSLAELHARLRAVTRRPPQFKESLITVSDLVLDAGTQAVTRAGRRISLTRKEFNLLEYFMRNTGTMLSRALIMERVWTADSDPFSNTVEAHIRNLRRKINAGGKANLIINIPGRGYVMDTPKNLSRF